MYKVIYLKESEDKLFKTKKDALDYITYLQLCTAIGKDILDLPDIEYYPVDKDDLFEVVIVDNKGKPFVHKCSNGATDVIQILIKDNK